MNVGRSNIALAADSDFTAPVLDGLGSRASVVKEGQYVCPECLGVFRPRVPRQLFCSAPHKRAWNNRGLKRGAVLFSLNMAARETRDGTRGDKATGKTASWQGNTLMQRWRDEDREAGRMGQVEYLRRRFALGFDAI